ncbi:MAG: trypsin-like peptidase domain-containing protein [Nitrospinota bacterium]|nr:trypsin-like peptidase domain-containing protein [Nitrospinota bacterium]
MPFALAPALARAQFSRRTPTVLAVRKVGPAVVNINTEEVVRQQSPFGGFPGFLPPEFERFFRGSDAPRRRKRRSLGTGVIIDAAGVILTNEHVIRRATRIRVSLIDRREFEAEVIGADSRTDLAVIRIRADRPLPYVNMGVSADLMPGETVIAIGNPFGLGHTVTTGVISGIHRAVRFKGGIQSDFIQTDAAINPGNSGGPLLNINGELIGINTAIRARAEGIGFSVPIDRVKRIVNDLVRFGKIQHGWIGLVVRDLTPPIRRQFGYSHPFGVFISRVIQGSAAARAGVRPGMILMRIGVKPVESRVVYLSDMSSYTEGSEMSLQLFSQGKVFRRGVVAQDMSPEAADAVAQDWLGVVARDLTPRARNRHRILAPDGVVITQTFPQGPADRAGLKPGDVIRKINNLRIRNFDNFRNAIASGLYLRDVVLLVQRDRHRAFVTLRLQN